MSKYTFKDLSDVVEGLINQGSTIKEILKVAKNTAIEMSPSELSVVYNGAHGGFGYSEIFDDWYSGDNHVNAFNRVFHNGQLIFKDFGRWFLNKHPMLEKIMKIYHAYDIRSIFKDVKSFRQLNKDIEEVKAKINHINSLILAGNTFNSINNKKLPESDNDIKVALISYSTYWFDDYNIEDLKTRVLPIAESWLETNKSSTEHLNKMHTYVLSFLKLWKKDTRYSSDYSSFADKLEQSGSYKWENQMFFDECEMSFVEWLINNHEKDLEEFGAWEDFNLESSEGTVVDYAGGWFQKKGMKADCPLEYIGRMLASGRYCRLSIAQVPSLADWSISEYDGLENVIW